MRARRVALGAGAAVVAIAVGLSGLWLPPSPAQIEWCLAERPALLREAERVMIETLGSVTDAYEGEDARTDPYYRERCLREYESAHGA